MIDPPAETRIWIAAGVTDMRRGFDGLASLVQTQLEADPFSGQIFAYSGRRGDRIKWALVSAQRVEIRMVTFTACRRGAATDCRAVCH